MIRPYLSDMIDHHKTHGKLKVCFGNKIIDYETPGEQKIQLTIECFLFLLKIILMKLTQCIEKVIM